jgi:hypothetical protein
MGPQPVSGPDIAPLPERARIEPSPPQKRLDALPVVYLVGFVILAASLIYLWKHPGIPPQAALEAAQMDTVRDQLNAIQARVDMLEKKPPAAPPDLSPIQAQITGLQTQLAALSARTAAGPADLKPLEARIAALEARPVPPPPPPPVDLGPLQQSVAAVATKEADDAAAMGKRLDALDAEVKQTDSRLVQVAQKAQVGSRLQAAAAALDAGQPLGDIPGAPPALAKFAHQAPPTEAALRLSFDTAAAAAQRVSQPPATADEPLLERMWSKATQAVTVRQGQHVVLGDPIAGVMAAAKQSLDAGDLAGAVKQLAGLTGPAKAAMAGWVTQAQALLDARAAIGDMAAHG